MCVYDYALHRLNLTVHWWFILKHIRIFRASDNAKDIHKVLPAFVPCFIDFVASLTNACCKSTLALKTAYSISPQGDCVPVMKCSCCTFAKNQGDARTSSVHVQSCTTLQSLRIYVHSSLFRGYPKLQTNQSTELLTCILRALFMAGI